MNAKTAQTRTICRAKATASLASITFFLLKKYFSYLRILHTVFWLNLTPLNPSSFPTQLLKNEQKQQKSKFKLYWPYKLDCGRPTRGHTLKANWVCFLEAISSQHLISYGCDFEHIFPPCACAGLWILPESVWTTSLLYLDSVVSLWPSPPPLLPSFHLLFLRDPWDLWEGAGNRIPLGAQPWLLVLLIVAICESLW